MKVFFGKLRIQYKHDNYKAKIRITRIKCISMPELVIRFWPNRSIWFTWYRYGRPKPIGRITSVKQTKDGLDVLGELDDSRWKDFLKNKKVNNER